MSELTEAFIPYVFALAFTAFYMLARPFGRRVAPIYGHSLGAVWLLLTWLLSGAGFWAAFRVSERSVVLAIALVVIAPLAAGMSILAYRDARRRPSTQRPESVNYD